jgi:putative chitinase
MGHTLRAKAQSEKSGSMILNLQIMQHRWPRGDQHVAGLLEGIVSVSEAVFTKYGLQTADDHRSRLVIAHAMAQFSEEAGQGLELVESTNYSAAGLLHTFPTHFTPSMAQRCAHNPKIIACIAYGGRMKNAPPPSTDGYDFRGRGLSQVTGREGYEALQKELSARGLDINIMENPDLIISPKYTLECGVADWVLCGCLPFAEKDDLLHETEKLNGGVIGLAERERQLVLWKKEFGC